MMGQSRASNSGWLTGAFALLALVLVVFFGTPLKAMVRGVFAEYIAPRVTDERYSGFSKFELAERLKKAEAELEAIRYQGMLHTLLVNENAELKFAASPLGFSKVIPARVLSRPPRTHYDTLLLDRGTSSGVKENDVVVMNGVALGKIISVS